MSNLKFCDSGEDLIDGKCTDLSLKDDSSEPGSDGATTTAIASTEKPGSDDSTASSGALLIPREEYLKHTLFKDSDGRSPKCDDCCDEGVPLEHTIRFFGKDYKKFWPCANGVLSFDNEVREFTPKAFPQTKYPIVAAFWADVDLRRCRAADQAFCSYWTVLYGEKAKLLDDKISNDYFKPPQIFRAKIALVQSWDGVGYFELNDHKRNTFQIVIVSDGMEHTFAGLYYDDIQWTTGDASDGMDGLGGTPAQMGFDRGDLQNFKAHEWSRTNKIIELKNKQFIYKMSNLKFCDAGENLVDGKCKQLSCSIHYKNKEPGVPQSQWGGLQYPIHQADGKGPTIGGKKNKDYVKPKNVDVGKCDKFLTEQYYKEYVPSGSTCVLQCAYEQDEAGGVYNTYQPKDNGANTDEALTSTCKSAKWSDDAAKNCVEIGLDVKVKDGQDQKIRVRESASDTLASIQVRLESRPHGRVNLLVRTSCKDGKLPTEKTDGGTTDDKFFQCFDNPTKPSEVTDPLASIKTTNAAKKIFANTLVFTADNWDVYQEVEFEGTNNERQSDEGYEKFDVLVSVSSSDEKCKVAGCAEEKPYAKYPVTKTIEGQLVDNEGLELVSTTGLYETDENGKELALSIDPSVKTPDGNTFENQEVKCDSSNPEEVVITEYRHGDQGAKTTYSQGDYIKFTDKKLFLFVAGQSDNVVDGDKRVEVSCSLKDENFGGSMLPVTVKNLDVNVPGIIVSTTMSANFSKADSANCTKAAPPPPMVDGCGNLQFFETKGDDKFTVKLATKPRKNVVIAVVSNNVEQVVVIPESRTFTPENWDTPQEFVVKGGGDDYKVQKDRVTETSVAIQVDPIATEDAGESTIDGSEVVHVLGYKNCVGAREGGSTAKGDDGAKQGATQAPGASTTTTPTTTTPTTAATTTMSTTTTATLDEALRQALEEANEARAKMQITCFSYTSDKVTGKNDPKPDRSQLTLNVRVTDETLDVVVIAAITGITAGVVVSVVVVVLVVLAIIGLLVAMAIRKQRGEEADRKQDMKAKADEAHDNIEFRVDAEMEDADMEDIKSPFSKLLGERDDLLEINKKLAAEVGESPMECASTDDPDSLVEQIKSLKGENDRLRDLQSQTSQRPKKKAGKKREGFGQQQD